MPLFIPTYFSPISQYAEIVKLNTFVFEMHDNYQKQSYRNRCYIYNTNGKQLLNIPVKHPTTSERKKTKDTLIDHDSLWQDHHFKSLKTAYRTSPFYEFFEHDIAHLLEKKHKYLQDLNIDTFLFISDALQLDINFTKTSEYKIIAREKDFRSFADVKNQPKKFVDNYIQMFDEKHGFIPNLSILDLLFMEGPNTISFL